MANHTPGPWKTSRYGDTIFCFINGRQEWIAYMNDADFRFEDLSEEESDEEQTANARLLAAAPELLDVCKTVYHWLGSGYSVSPDIGEIEEELERVIAKAIGEKN